MCELWLWHTYKTVSLLLFFLFVRSVCVWCIYHIQGQNCLCTWDYRRGDGRLKFIQCVCVKQKLLIDKWLILYITHPRQSFSIPRMCWWWWVIRFCSSSGHLFPSYVPSSSTLQLSVNLTDVRQWLAVTKKNKTVLSIKIFVNCRAQYSECPRDKHSGFIRCHK